MSLYKVTVEVPKDYLEQFKCKLLSRDFNYIGGYKNRISWYEVTSSRTIYDNSGERIEETFEDLNIRFELICDERQLDTVINHIYDSHPYNQVVVEVSPTVIFTKTERNTTL